MSREIKFRAYRKSGGVMSGWASVCAYVAQFQPNLAELFSGEGDGDLVLMQFTGLHDVDGKEIYEGDIVQYTAHKGYLLPDFVAEICYANEYASFGFQVDGDPARWSAFAEFDEAQRDVLDYIVVIGNIHEHPHLLNENR